MGIYAKYIFPRLLDRFMKKESIRSLRKTLIPRAKGEVLEIGFGTGLNLPYYSNAVSALHVLDTNEGMHSLALKRVNDSPLQIKAHIISAETIPFEDESFDIVVSTFTLCSIADVSSALREMARVLKPTGEFLFLEHILSSHMSMRKWQNRMNFFWKIYGDGCHINRDMKDLISSNGFKITEYHTFELKDLPGIMREGCWGSAKKS